MSIQRSGPEYEIGRRGDDPIWPAPLDRHLVLVPEPDEQTAAPTQPGVLASDGADYTAVTSMEQASLRPNTPVAQNDKYTLRDLHIGRVAGNDCYRVPRFKPGE